MSNISAESVTLTWASPLIGENDAPLRRYRVQQRGHGGGVVQEFKTAVEVDQLAATISASGLSSRAEVQGLSPASGYEFRIVPVNDAGDGPPSGSIIVETSAGIAPPPAVGAVGAGSAGGAGGVGSTAVVAAATPTVANLLASPVPPPQGLARVAQVAEVAPNAAVAAPAQTVAVADCHSCGSAIPVSGGRLSWLYV